MACTSAIAAVALALAGCWPAPRRGVEVRRGEVFAGVDADGGIEGEPTGRFTCLYRHDGLQAIDWSTRAVVTVAPDTLERPPCDWHQTTAPAAGAPGWRAGLRWFDARAAVPVVTIAPGPGFAVEGWRRDGARAWRVELPGEPRFVLHAGASVLVQWPGEYQDGWPDGGTIAIDDATGAIRWRRSAYEAGDPVAQRGAVHGDEVVLAYEAPTRVDVIALGDGVRRRRIRIDRTLGVAGDVGFDGQVLWAFTFWPEHDNPGDHMLGTFPGPPTPARCEYAVWDLRHDRGHPIRTEPDLPTWMTACRVRAMTALDDGGVQVILGPTGVTSLWFDHPP